MTPTVTGTALYFRGISQRYPAPEQVVQRCRSLKLSWAALGACWQDDSTGKVKTTLMNGIDKIHAYADALAAAGIIPYVWGYPWAGAVDEFIDVMDRASGDHKLILIDPEVGMNPIAKNPATRAQASQPAAMSAARAMAAKIVTGLRSKGAKKIGLSTYGNVPRWFPLDAFLREGLDFAGGQTYTDDTTVEGSEERFLQAIEAAGSQAQLVPNFGCYKFIQRDGRRIATSKSTAEQQAHLAEFVHTPGEIRAAIGWAENFVTGSNAGPIAAFSDVMARGGTALPPAP
jgi:hypothetical protein